MTDADSPCPCTSGKTFSDCCGPYLSGEKIAPTAESLMRSRYSAYATGNIDYLHDTLVEDTRGDFDRDAAVEWSAAATWTGLEIKSTENGKANDSDGYVEFVARFTQDEQERLHHETGHFVKIGGRWLYADGYNGTRPVRVDKIGRNDPCPCGSGKKYKKCCALKAA